MMRNLLKQIINNKLQEALYGVKFLSVEKNKK